MNKKSDSQRKSNKRMAVAFSVIFIVLVSAMIFILCVYKTGKNKEDNVSTKKWEIADIELAGIMDNLEQMDKALTVNQSALMDVKSYQTEITESFIDLGESISQIEKQFRKYVNTVEGNISNELTGIADGLEQVQKNILDSQQEIISVLNELKAGEEKNKSEISGRLEEIRQKIERYEKRLEEISDSISVQLEEIKKGDKEQHQELIKLLEEAEERINSILGTEMEQLKKFVDIRFYEMQLQMEQDVIILAEKIENLHNQIEAAKSELLLFQKAASEERTNHQEEIRKAFSELQQLLGQIYTDFNQSHEEIRELILKLQEIEGMGQKELLEALEKMESGMQDSNGENLNQILNNLHQLAEQNNTLFQGFEQKMNENILNIGSDMEKHLNCIETTMGSQHSNLSASIYQTDEGLREYLSGKFGTMERELQEVFQCVSDGKKRVASALLTKGVNIKKDATFQEITEAILSIAQTLVIGEAQMPGEITYEYHYHTDKSGNTPHADMSAQKGGCYTSPVYHIHSGDSLHSGGCYTVPVMHTHEESCYQVIRKVREITGYWFTGEGTGHGCCDSAHGENRAKYRYKYSVYENGVLVNEEMGEGDLGYCCGLCIEKKAYRNGFDSTETAVVCGLSEGLNRYDLGCGKHENTVEAYRIECGLGDGQITGAHIVYIKGMAENSAGRITDVIAEEKTSEGGAELGIEKIKEEKAEVVEEAEPEEKAEAGEKIELEKAEG